MDEMNWKPNSKDAWLSAGVVVLVVAAFLLNPETIPAGNGFGFDGVIYARMVAEIDQMIANGELSTYYAQRILPAVLVRFGLSSLGLPLDAAHIISGFRVLNVVSLAMCVVFWMAIARRIGISRLAYWIGIAGLLLIFPNAKQALYYPVTTDSFAFMIGLALVWSHVSGRLVPLAVFSIIGSFAWQISGLVGAVLLLSRLVGEDRTRGAIVTFTPAAYRRARLLVILVSACLMVAIGVPYLAGVDLETLIFGAPLEYDPILRILTNIPLLALVFIFLVTLWMETLSAGWRLNADLGRLAAVVLLVLAVFTVPNVIVERISNPSIPPPGISGYVETLKALLYERAREKLVFLPLVAHSVYYGPVFILFVLFWRRMAQTAVRLGIGFVLVISVFVILSVFTESRFTFLLWPFVVTLVAKTVSPVRFGKPALLALSVAILYFSKLWLTINQAEWSLPDFAGIYEWPKSAYFSHLGPFINGEDYVRQGALVLATALLFFFLLRGGNTMAVADRSKA